MKTKYIVVPYPGHTFEQMFRMWSSFLQEGACESYPYMLKRSFSKSDIELCPPTEETFAQSKVMIHWDIFDVKLIKKYPKKKHLYIASEPAIVCIAHTKYNIQKLSALVYDAVITTHGEINTERVYQVRNPRAFPKQRIAKDDVVFHDKKLACMFAGNKYAFGKHEQYSIRRKIVRYFEKYAADDFDLYGHGWDGPYKRFKVYRGPADDKLEVSSHYKFSFCLENERFVKSNITEKIFDAMIVGTVPVYEGMDDIEDFVPANCFIKYSRFSSIEDCVEYLKNMSEEEYLRYKENIKRYICSDETRKMFSAENMRDQIIRAVQEQTTQKKHRALWLLDLYAIEQKAYNALCRLQKYFDYLKLEFWK